MRLVGPALALGILVVSVVGCASGSSSAGPSSPGEPAASGQAGAGAPSPAPASAPAESLVWLPEWAGDDVPDQVANRRPLPFCGVERAPQPQPGMFIDRAVRLCFWNAHLAHAAAEFVSLQSTMEGSPIATIYRLSPDGTVEVFTDFTQDAFGSGAWQLSTCADIVEGEGAELLGVAECDEGVTLN